MHYRLRQLIRALLGRIDANDQALVARLLAGEQRLLFERMPRFDQRHALDVCRVLIGAGQRDPALLQAALLHDCGKVGDDGQPIPLLYYGLFVVLQQLAPSLYRRAEADGRGPLRHFRTHATHEARSARLAAQAGCPPKVIAIINSYQQDHASGLANWLRWADNQC